MDTRPALIVQLRLEESPQVRVDAASYEDEQRLRMWLRRTSAVDALLDAAAWLLDDDEFDGENAA